VSLDGSQSADGDRTGYADFGGCGFCLMRRGKSDAMNKA
jgi:hypothetical protein